MTEPYITAAWLVWLATLSRNESPDVEQAFAAGYRAAAYDIAREVGILKKLVADDTLKEPGP